MGHPARTSEPGEAVGLEAEPVSPNRLIMLLPALQLLRYGMDVAKAPFERVGGENRVGSGGMIGDVDDIARLVNGKSCSEPDRHSLVEGQLPRPGRPPR